MNKEIRYHVGIDFGAGETTASCFDLKDKKRTRLNILDANTDEGKKLESAVCRDDENGWRIARNENEYSQPDFTINFKHKISDIKDDKNTLEAFSAFIRFTFDLILKNNSFLEYDPATQERNFEVYIACPSGWNEEILEYLEFFRKQIPFVKNIIKESDAAYFKFRNEIKANGTVLVIDIGSSTIDFTAYDEKGECQSYGYPDGAQNVEMAILKYIEENDEAFKEAKAKIEDALSEVGASIKWRNTALHKIKECKETFYTRIYDSLGVNLGAKKIVPTLLGVMLFDDIEIDKTTLEETILSAYREKLKLDFNIIAERVKPSEVILTGGASRMPWLQELVKSVFCIGGNTNLQRDSEPSYVVSDGIAEYAYANILRNELLEELEKKFWQEYNDEKISQVINEAFSAAVQKIQLPMIKSICNDFVDGKFTDANGRHSTQTIMLEMRRHNDTIVGKNSVEIQTAIVDNLNNTLQNQLTTAIEDVFKKCYGSKKMEFSLPISISIDFGNLPIDNGTDIEWIKKITAEVYATWGGLNDGRIDKDRPTPEERRKFTDLFYEKQENATISLKGQLLQNAINNIRGILKKALMEVRLKAPFQIYS